ncbi:TetR/AcrR family transcriptional regulator [Cohnella caldifontis]|uniref:TetR/AcrR family transcriptional regulator n=1 Tax=Cohnella caldifontis TaxID=3027471 RepID=UPI0023EBC43E|nr:TetR/AcrR family transcriptional regulator [Cohnella sp. YIM B05605]
MNGFEKRSRQIKEKIVKTTIDLLGTTDPNRIRIADIANAAKVSQVTIYNHFESKENLLREAIKQFLEVMIADFETYLNESHSLKEKIEYILFREKQYFKLIPPRVLQELMLSDPEMAGYVERIYLEKSLPMTVRILEEGKQNGEISERVSIENVLALMQLYMNQYETMLRMAGESGDVERFVEEMVHLFFYGICGKE